MQDSPPRPRWLRPRPRALFGSSWAARHLLSLTEVVTPGGALLTGMALCLPMSACGGKTGKTHHGDDAAEASGGGNDAGGRGAAEAGRNAGAAGAPSTAATGGRPGAAGSGGNDASAGETSTGVWTMPPATVVIEEAEATAVVEDPLPSAAECVEPESAYQIDSADACLTEPFACARGEAAFADGCGCGCTGARSNETGAALEVAIDGALIDLPAECHGPSRLLALFTGKVTEMILLRDVVYVLVSSPHSRESQLWTVGKANGELSLLTAGSIAFGAMAADRMGTPGGVVSSRAEVCDGGDGYTYYMTDEYPPSLVRAPTTGGIQQLVAPFPDEPFGLLVQDSEVFAALYDGTLWHTRFDEIPAQMAPIEQLGAYDEDDYDPLIGMDDDAVYWFAGPSLEQRSSDTDSIALYRTCRPNRG